MESQISDFLGYPLVGCPVPECSDDLIKKSGAVYHASLASVLNWVLTGQIKAYQNNRGKGKVSKATFDRIYEDGVCPDVVGELTFGFHEVDGKKELCLNNWHSRMRAFLARYKDGLMSNSELKTLIAIRVQTEFIPSYQKMNAPGSAHKTKDKISNPDLAYGSHLKKIFDKIGIDTERLIGENKWTVLSAIMYNLAKGKVKDWYWPMVYRLRQDARVEADKEAGTLKISEAKIEDLIRAINFWAMLMMQLENDNVNKIKIGKVVKSAGFFGYIIADQLGPKEIHPSIKITSNRIFSNFDKIMGSLPELTRGNDQTMAKFTASIDKVFKQLSKIKSE